MHPQIYWWLVQQQRDQALADAQLRRVRQAPQHAPHRRAPRVR